MIELEFPGPYSSYAQVYSAVPVGNIFIFTAYNTTNGFEMWQSDGTPAGTTIFKDIVPGSNSGNPILLPAYKWDAATGTLIHPLLPGNKFFLRATTNAAGSEMWVCNGTAAGTTILKDIKLAPQMEYPIHLIFTVPPNIILQPITE